MSSVLPIYEHCFILFKNSKYMHHKKIDGETFIEEPGGSFSNSTDTYTNTAVRELFEESAGLINLAEHRKELSGTFKIRLRKSFVCHVINLNFDAADITKEKLAKYYNNNSRKFIKNGYSPYSETSQIVFIPITYKKIEENHVYDYKKRKYYISPRTKALINIYYSKKNRSPKNSVEENKIKDFNLKKIKINSKINYKDYSDNMHSVTGIYNFI